MSEVVAIDTQPPGRRAVSCQALRAVLCIACISIRLVINIFLVNNNIGKGLKDRDLDNFILLC